MAQGPITVWLERWRAGDPEALDRRLPLAHRGLREAARRQLRREWPASTLSATALVHEAHVPLYGLRQLAAVDRTHSFAIAAGTRGRVPVDAGLTLAETAPALGPSSKSVRRARITAAACPRQGLDGAGRESEP